MNDLVEQLRTKINQLQKRLIDAEDVLWQIAHAEETNKSIRIRIQSYMKTANAIETLDLPEATCFLLHDSGIFTIKDLCSKSEMEIRYIQSLGDLKLRTIRKQMKIHGLEFGYYE